MSWKNLKIGKKLSIGFGAIIVLLVFLSIFNYRSFNSIKDNVSLVEEANLNTQFMIEKEVDHLTWLSGLSNLFLIKMPKKFRSNWMTINAVWESGSIVRKLRNWRLLTPNLVCYLIN